jgi:hypothetical protein
MRFEYIICMSAIKRQPSKANDSSNIKSLVIVGGVIAIGALLLFAYLMWYVAPDENIERVKIIVVTEAGCIAETYDGFAVNIGKCLDKPGEYVLAPVDQKTKERAAAMNPTK